MNKLAILTKAELIELIAQEDVTLVASGLIDHLDDATEIRFVLATPRRSKHPAILKLRSA